MTKRILITGANKGIGLATVEAVLSARDDTWVWLGSRDGGRGTAARDALVGHNPAWAARVEVLKIDVSSDASVGEAAKQIERALDGGALYGVVNNAGIVGGTLQQILDVNTFGTRQVCARLLPLMKPGGRVVNVSSASGPSYVASCSVARQRVLTSPDATWAQLEALIAERIELERSGGDCAAAGLGDGAPYGFSKACLNAFTIALARDNPSLWINACTPGFIDTDATRPFAEAQGKTPEEMGMKPTDQGTRAALHLLFEDVGGRGWYFGSDAQRSPLDRYRSPGDPPYDGS